MQTIFSITFSTHYSARVNDSTCYKIVRFMEALELTLSLYSARRNLGPPKSQFLQCDVSVYGTVQEPIVGSIGTYTSLS